LRYQSAICVYARAVASFIALALTAPSRLLQQLVNLLLLRGNFGKPGGGISPIRGHSNVQGDRTVGIDEKPSQEDLDRVRDVFGFEPPRQRCRTALRRYLSRWVATSFVRSPDTERSYAAMRKLALTVGIAIKLNRGHLVHGVTLLGHLDPVILSRFFGTRRTSRPAPC
jgi:anaerobic selenocysteine-containing dehydrogenase